MPQQIYNVIFLCTGNSARSILAEAILNREEQGRFKAFSAGSRPTGSVNPYAVSLLESMKFDTTFARSKSWDEFAATNAPNMDFVLTVCDNAAREVCPIWPGHPLTANMGIPDPAAVKGTKNEIEAAFSNAYQQLSERIAMFIQLPLENIDKRTLQDHFNEFDVHAS
jgi:arsenate reductase (thioredoxin)